jgi:PIN domain nuclease of toxin-antitoxin system
MNVILDTHILLWFLSGDKKLSQKQKSIITDVQNTKFVSIATAMHLHLIFA